MDRLGFLQSVGLEYLTLSRSSGTLSGGESQRIRLATQIGSSLVGVLYILDEPSIGLHQRDNDKLLATLKRLRDLGNTLIVVEHDEDTMLAADHIVDIGPGAGRNGGEVVSQRHGGRAAEEPIPSPVSISPAAKFIPVPEVRRKGSGKKLTVKGCAVNNLKHIDVTIPLGTLTCVTGVSGSGKSSLVDEILYKKLAAELNGARTRPGAFDGIEGLENLDKVIDIDQSPIGRTPRSNPATYTGVFNDIRDLFAKTARREGARLRPGPLLLQRQGRPLRGVRGRRPDQDRNALPAGRLRPLRRLQGHALQPRDARGALQGQEHLRGARHDGGRGAASSSRTFRRSRSKLQTHARGRASAISSSVSPPRRSRAARRSALSSRPSFPSAPTGRTIYILDEPTTGLHVADVHKLIDVLQKLVRRGEHGRRHRAQPRRHQGRGLYP